MSAAGVDAVKSVHMLLPLSTWKMLKRKLLEEDRKMCEFFRDAVEAKLNEGKRTGKK